MKNILITGGAGFIGTNLIKYFLKKEYNVISIDNYSTGLKSNHQEGCNYIELDIREISDYSFLGPIDIVYHLAAIARIQPSFERPEDYFTTNANATLKLAKWCSDNNIPLVYAGSSSHHSGKFKNPYTFSKDVGEDIIRLFQEHYNLKASIARFYNVYGPHHLKEGGYCTLIGTWEQAIEKRKPLIIYGDGSKRRDFTHVDDIIEALTRIPIYDAWGYVFELGRGKNYSIIEIALMFKGATIAYAPNKPGEAQETLCDYTLAKDILKWEPKIDIKNYLYENNL